MSRIPYPNEELLPDDARELLDSLPPLNIVRMVANAPAALRPLTDLGQAILLHGELDPRLRQIAILCVARVTRSGYEQAQHENVSRLVGLEQSEIDAATSGRLDALAPHEQLVGRFAEQIARDVRAEEETTAQVLRLLGQRQTVELVVACAYYCLVARVIETCGVELEDVLPTADIDPDEWLEGPAPAR
ncbi:MAG: carboxymuconolactone decarboxylase family protein [Solirubrobacteraceae bacterium]|jgi:alkylhydroperoxidase family enzyme